MSAEFYLKDVTHKHVKGHEVVHKDVLFFKQARSGFDGVATHDHVKQYPGQFEEFKSKHKGYELPAHFTETEIGKPGASAFHSAEEIGHAPSPLAPAAPKGKKK